MHASELWAVTLPEMAAMFAEREPAQEWLKRCRAVLFNHGSVLVDAFGHSGMTDNIRAADEVLVHWFKAGLIYPAPKATPSTSQQFFGHGGMWWQKGLKSRPEQHPPCFFGWMPVRGSPA